MDQNKLPLEPRHLELLVTENYHRVHPKWFLSPLYIWCKTCMYLAPTLTLSPNILKQDSTYPCCLGDLSGASKLIYEPMVRWRKMCTYLVSRLPLSPNAPKRASTALSPRSTIGCIQNDIWANSRLAQTVHLSCTDTNTVSKWTKMRFHMTHVT
jgi:hypothetical protein